MNSLVLTQNDTGPRLFFDLQDHLDVDVNLTGATVKFTLRKLGQKEAVFSRACEIDDAENGTCYYDWQEGDLAVAGIYTGEISIVFANEQQQTVATTFSFVVKPSLVNIEEE